MRIHWSIVILAVIGTIALTWHLRTREMDFMTPKGIILAKLDDGPDLASEAIAPQPKIENNPQVTEVLGNPEVQVIPEIPEITEADLGDLEASPGLDSYRDFAQKNPPQRLLELSSTLRTRGQFQRALLALERVIDSTKADAAVIDEATQGIIALTENLPAWNIDPTLEIPLTLNLSIAKTASESLTTATLEVTKLIRTSSGEQLEIIPKITSSKAPDAPEDRPIALWLATTSEEPLSSAVVTLRISEEKDALINELALAVFQAVRGDLAKLGYTPPLSIRANGRDALAAQITRLMWRDFSRSLLARQEKIQPQEEEN